MDGTATTESVQSTQLSSSEGIELNETEIPGMKVPLLKRKEVGKW